MYGSGSGRTHGSISKSGLADGSIIEPRAKPYPQDTIVRYNTNNTSDENVRQGAVGIKGRVSIQLAMNRSRRKLSEGLVFCGV